MVSLKTLLVLCTVICIVISPMNAMNAVPSELKSIHLRVQRDTEVDASVCDTETICAWEVYDARTRIKDYYLPNTCKCKDTDECWRAEDNLANNLFIFRCRIKHVGN